MSNMVDGGQLRSFVERIEKLESEKRDLVDDIRDVCAEAKATGFDAKILRRVVAMRRVDRAKREEEAEMIECYLAALGDLAETPLGKSAIVREFGRH